MKRATGIASRLAGILSVMMVVVADADTIYVNGPCGNNAWSGSNSVCSAPNGPKQTIQAGIDASVNGDTVFVADGTYTGAGNKNLDFGGKGITVRSQSGPATCIIDCEGDGRGFYFHNGETDDAVLDGFTIRNGHVFRSSPGEWNGGAILCESASPTILNCVLADNEAFEGGGLFNHVSDPMVANCTFSGNFALRGGGMSNSSSDPTVIDCTFSDNSTENGSSSRGGGMYNWNSSSPTVTNCTFTNNATYFYGGGMCNWGSDIPIVTNCTFSGNSAGMLGGGMMNVSTDPTVTNCTFSGNLATGGDSRGGGMYNYFSSPPVTNCTFTDNSSRVFGGGMYNASTSGPRLTNCTFSGNSADAGGGIYNRNSSGGTRLTVTNSILWNNGPSEIVDFVGAETIVRFSDVRGGWTGESNVDADPLFVDPSNGDYRLAPGSPCIDAADNTAVPSGIRTDLDGNPRFVDDPATPDCQWLPGTCGDPPIADMGAYEFPSQCEPCDANCDGQINALDIEPFLDLLFDPHQEPCNECTGDINGDGAVNAFDIEPFLDCLFP